MQAQVEACDDSEEAGAGAARGPHHIRIALVVGADEIAIREDNVDCRKARRRGAEQPRSPVEPPTEDVATDADGWTRSRGEPGADLFEPRREFASIHGRSHRGCHRRRIHVDLTHSREIEEKAAVANPVADPAMATGADPYLQPRLLGQPNGRYHVCVVFGKDDQLGVPIWFPAVPDRSKPCFLVVGFAATQRRQRHRIRSAPRALRSSRSRDRPDRPRAHPGPFPIPRAEASSPRPAGTARTAAP